MISENEIDSAYELTRKLTEDCYPRLTGMDGCIKAADIIEDELSFCDNVYRDEFTHRPRGFLKFLPIAASIHLLGILFLYLDFLLVGSLLFTLNAFMFFSQLLFYWGFFDFPFKKETGHNIIGTIEPSGEVKQQLIFSGHYDAPYVFTLIDKIPKYYVLVFSIGLGTVLMSFVVSWLFVIFAWNIQIYTIVVSALSVFVLPFFIFTTSKISPGAGDNAIAVGLIVEIGKVLSREKLKHSRIIILALDAEEAGLNGARAYVNKYKDDLHSIPSYNFNIDSIYEKQYLRVFTRDLNSIRKLSEMDAKLIQELSEELGHPIPASAMPLGGGSTDSAEFSRIGIDSIAYVGLNLDGMDQTTAYHSTRDDMSAIHKDSIEFSLNLMIAYARKKDELSTG
ncbi:MAG: M28 family peptidase [Candidatus Heimdallarchaeota archaeon]|nr:M28 family peptidase [Candidatus Heimdallarchaeota archaeon]